MNRRITCLVMCSLLSVSILGCKKDNPYPKGSSAYINTKGEIVSEIYTSDYFLCRFDDRGFAKIYNRIDDYYIDKDFNIVGEGIFPSTTRCISREYDGKDYFYVRTDSGGDIYDEDMKLVMSRTCDMRYIESPKAGVKPIGANGWLGAFDGDKWGYIDLEGNNVIDYLYSDVGEFTEDGVARVKADNGLWGVIDEQGDYLIEPKYKDMSDFSCGRALAVESNDEQGYKLIDLEGNVVSDNTFMGNIVHENGFKYSDFSYCDGLARVEIADTKAKSYLYGYIDLDGNYVIEPKYTYAYDFSNGYATVEENDKEYLVIDKEGNPLVVDGVKACGCPSEEGFFPAMKDGLCGYYSAKTHEWVIKPQFSSGGEFHSGYAVVNLN